MNLKGFHFFPSAVLLVTLVSGFRTDRTVTVRHTSQSLGAGGGGFRRKFIHLFLRSMFSLTDVQRTGGGRSHHRPSYYA